MLEQLQKVESAYQARISDSGSQSAGNALDLAWLAGFLDGEGSFFLAQYVQDSGRWRGMKPQMRVANTHKPSIERAAAILAANGVGAWISQPRLTRRQRPFWTLAVGGLKRIARLTTLLLPYLTTKKEQAALLLEFAQSRLVQPDMKCGYSEREAGIHQALSALNQPRHLRDYKRPLVRIMQKPLGRTKQDIVRPASESSQSAAEMTAPAA